MIFWVLSFLFLAIAFIPRFFTFMNFGYGFSDLGLYSQFLAGLGQNDFNLMIPSFGHKFLELKPEPFLYLFFPLAHSTVSPTVFLFMDIACLIVAAGVCARAGWVALHQRPVVNALFFIVLFSPLTLESLHAPTRVTVWAQAPLALLMAEYLLQRRPKPMTFWFIILCAMNLSFGALALVLAPLCLMTRMGRWNFRRRFSSAWPLLVVGAVSLWCLKLTGNHLAFEYDFFWATLGNSLIILLVSFWILPILSFEILPVALFLMVLKIPGATHDVSLIVPLGALATVQALEFLAVKESWINRLVAAGMVATVIYLNINLEDPFFTPWKPQHYRLLSESKEFHDILAQIPPDALVVSSDVFSVHLTQHLDMAILGSWVVRNMTPDYVISQNQLTPFDNDRRYQAVEIKSEPGTRLLKRIK